MCRSKVPMLRDVESVTLFKWEAKTYPFNYSLKLKRKKKKNSSWLTMKMFSSVPFVKNNTFISYRYWPTRHVYICSFMTQNMQLYWVTMSTVCTVDLLSCCQLIFAFHLSVASPDKVMFSTEDIKICPEAYATNKHIWHSYAFFPLASSTKPKAPVGDNGYRDGGYQLSPLSWGLCISTLI